MPKARVAGPGGGLPGSDTQLVYSPTARRFHWLVVAMVALQVPLGAYMAYRGNTLNLWDGLTNTLYSSHKLLGISVLAVVIARLVYRLRHGAPPDEPSLARWQKAAAHVTHWSLYALLVLVPIVGWLGASRYPALDLFGVVSLPGLVAPDQAAAAKLFFAHKVLAILTVLLIAAHIGAALMHYVIFKDGVLQRMLPGMPRR